jgi:hypothetical protein
MIMRADRANEAEALLLTGQSSPILLQMNDPGYMFSSPLLPKHYSDAMRAGFYPAHCCRASCWADPAERVPERIRGQTGALHPSVPRFPQISRLLFVGCSQLRIEIVRSQLFSARQQLHQVCKWRISILRVFRVKLCNRGHVRTEVWTC